MKYTTRTINDGEVLNLNNEKYFALNFKSGKTQNLILKVSRKRFYADIDKNADSITIEVYDFVSASRSDFSKYNANLHYLTYTNKDFTLSRDFIEMMPSICHALTVLQTNGYINGLHFNY